MRLGRDFVFSLTTETWRGHRGRIMKCFSSGINSSLWTHFFFCGADLWFFCELMNAGTQPKWTWQDQEQQTSDQLYVMFNHEQILCCPGSAVFFFFSVFFYCTRVVFIHGFEKRCVCWCQQRSDLFFFTQSRWVQSAGSCSVSTSINTSRAQLGCGSAGPAAPIQTRSWGIMKELSRS